MEGDHVVRQSTPPNQNGGVMAGRNQFGSGGWSPFPIQFPFPFVPFPTWGSPHTPPVAAGAGNSQLPHGFTFGLDQPGSLCAQGQGEGGEDDYLDLLDEDEALKLVHYYAWKACDAINTFIKPGDFKRWDHERLS